MTESEAHAEELAVEPRTAAQPTATPATKSESKLASKFTSKPTSKPTDGERVALAAQWIYPAALLGALSIWFLALRAPLWLDETLAYWQVSAGFAKVWTRSALMPSSIGYLYTLWLAKSLLGSSEVALKIPSLFALLGAVYFLFRSAGEWCDRETGVLAAIFFALEANVVFAATDARPYGFALLATSAATFAFIRWMRRRGLRDAILFGAAAAAIVYFHYLFSSILPAFALYYMAARFATRNSDSRLSAPPPALKQELVQLAGAATAFVVLVIPLIVRVASLVQTRDTHIVQEMQHPFLVALNFLAPQQTLIGFIAVAFVAAVIRKLKLPAREDFPQLLLFPLLALVPAAVLFTMSAVTPAHLVIPRYLTVVAPGSALTWAVLTRQVDSRALRLTFATALVAVTMYECYTSPLSRRHEMNFKQAHAFVNARLAGEKAPVLECSAFIESNYEPMPTDPAAENALWSQVSYYPIHAPVVMMPMALDDQAMQIGRRIVLQAAAERQRFLLVAGPTSYGTANWLADYARANFTAQIVGTFDGIVVVEFRPVAAPE